MAIRSPFSAFAEYRKQQAWLRRVRSGRLSWISPEEQKRRNRREFWTALIFTLLLVLLGIVGGWWGMSIKD